MSALRGGLARATTLWEHGGNSVRIVAKEAITQEEGGQPVEFRGSASGSSHRRVPRWRARAGGAVRAPFAAKCMRSCARASRKHLEQREQKNIIVKPPMPVNYSLGRPSQSAYLTPVRIFDIPAVPPRPLLLRASANRLRGLCYNGVSRAPAAEM